MIQNETKARDVMIFSPHHQMTPAELGEHQQMLPWHYPQHHPERSVARREIQHQEADAEHCPSRRKQILQPWPEMYTYHTEIMLKLSHLNCVQFNICMFVSSQFYCKAATLCSQHNQLLYLVFSKETLEPSTGTEKFCIIQSKVVI